MSNASEAIGGRVGEAGELDMRAIGRALWRRKWWFLVPTLVVALLTTIGVNLLTPRYKSEARILYDGRENVFLRPEADRSQLDRSAADQEALTSQVQLILSRELALKVIADLKLGERQEFDPLNQGLPLYKQALVFLGVSRDPYRMTQEERVLGAWYEKLTAYAIDKSRVLALEFQSLDPVLAARVANAIAQTYLEMQQATKQQEMQAASAWLSGEIERLRREVAEAEARVEAFRSKSNLFVGTNNTTLSNQQLGELNTSLGAARAQKADADTRARLIRDMLRRGDPIEASEIVNSEIIRRLSEQRVNLRAQLAEQSSTLLDNHPRIKGLKAQIADLDTQIRAEAEKLVRTLENDARIANARVAALEANFDTLKRQAASTNEDDVRLRALERDAKSKRDLLENYLAKYREATARENIGQTPADARIISRGIVSNTPFFPKKLPIVLVATLATLMISTGLLTAGELMRASAQRPAHRASADHEMPEAAGDTRFVAMSAIVSGRIAAPRPPLAARLAGTAEDPALPPREPPAGALPPRAAADRPDGPVDLDVTTAGPAAVATDHAATDDAETKDAENPAAGDATETVVTESAATTSAVSEEASHDPADIAGAAEPTAEAEAEAVPTAAETAPTAPQAPTAAETALDGAVVGSIDELVDCLRGPAGRRIAVFGTRPDARTTHAAVAVARLLARDSLVVLVRLGADPVDPAAALPGGDGPGLTEMVRGEATFGEIIARDKASRAHIVPRGTGEADTGALVGSLRFVTMVDALARTYDHVVIEAGACAEAAADQMAEMAPAGVLVVPEATDPAVGTAREKLAEAGYDTPILLVGAPLTAPSPQTEAA
ncbi:lipopolysaccharide biosynthesis [Rhodovulum sp. PH10]|uniref:exopolysaccharide transport family protein n=1 Tax=Rhodovulum sp. PH10 TaxID=1187851 RepID=UPI00027C1F46|nr:exopolysaccharide transport family protein [Rhodovulum sp. PH10]EJW09532.1 lipopolysaccharide biosynthesis [Rhodovulum sp. PH10]